MKKIKRILKQIHAMLIIMAIQGKRIKLRDNGITNGKLNEIDVINKQNAPIKQWKMTKPLVEVQT